MASHSLGNFDFDLWADIEPLYGPQPKIGEQVFGRPMEPEPVALIRNSEVRFQSAQLASATPVAVQDEVYFSYRFYNSGHSVGPLDEWFIIPVLFKLEVSEQQEAPGNAWLGDFYPVCFAEWRTVATQRYVIAAGSPVLSSLGGTGAKNYVPYAPGQPNEVRTQSYNFGFPRLGTQHWINHQGDFHASAVFKLYTNQGWTSRSFKPWEVRFYFEGLAYPLVEKGHSAFVKWMASSPAVPSENIVLSANQPAT